MPRPNPKDEIAYLHLRLFADRTMAITGNLADPKMGKDMLEAALESVRRLHARGEVLLPGGYHEAFPDPRFPVLPKGDRPREGAGSGKTVDGLEA